MPEKNAWGIITKWRINHWAPKADRMASSNSKNMLQLNKQIDKGDHYPCNNKFPPRWFEKFPHTSTMNFDDFSVKFRVSCCFLARLHDTKRGVRCGLISVSTTSHIKTPDCDYYMTLAAYSSKHLP